MLTQLDKWKQVYISESPAVTIIRSCLRIHGRSIHGLQDPSSHMPKSRGAQVLCIILGSICT